jgi:hypothetical protein
MHLPENSFAQLIRTTGIVFYLLRTPLEIKWRIFQDQDWYYSFHIVPVNILRCCIQHRSGALQSWTGLNSCEKMQQTTNYIDTYECLLRFYLARILFVYKLDTF